MKMKTFFAFVDKLERLDPDQIGNLSNESIKTHLQRYRAYHGRDDVHPNQEVVLDCIDEKHFLNKYKNIGPLDLKDPKSGENRRNELTANDVFSAEKMRVYTAWFNNNTEREYLERFQPSTWHLITIGKDGIPVMESLAYGDEEYITVNLSSASPPTPSDLSALYDIVSVDHLPEAGRSNPDVVDRKY